MVKKISSIDIAKLNRNMIYKNIYFSSENITVNKLVKRLKLSRPTVENNIKALIEDGLIENGKHIESTGGRKPKTLEIVANHKYAMACLISYKYISVGIVNLAGELIDELDIDWIFKNSKEYFDDINATIKKMIKKWNIKRENLLGISIVIPGPIDSSLDEVIYSPPLANEYIDIKYLKSVIDLPVSVINDVNAIGIGKHFFDEDDDYNAVYLNLARGIGGFIWSGGHKYIGDNGIAGEFGHMKIVPKGKKCHCSRHGCLEAYISTSCISDELNMTLEEFFEKLDKNSKKITEKWFEYLDYLAIGITNIYCVFNCKVLIGGEITAHLQEYKKVLDDKVRSYLSFDKDKTIYEISNYDKKDIIFGSCVYYINKYIDTI